jgi:porphobilinogen synthase
VVIAMSYPIHRLRRLRQTASVRRLVRETTLSAGNLICPLFVTGLRDARRPLEALPGVSLLSGAPLEGEVRALEDLGVAAVLLFSVLEDHEKDEQASLACSPEGPVQLAVQRIKQAAPGMVVIADLCLCEYTSDGHCGLLKGGHIDNDATLLRLQQAAVSLAAAGSDVIAPSGMMDGMVQAIRSALDGAGFQNVLTMPYSAKFASCLYGPFKTATRSAPSESKHATHQLDVANARQALEEIRMDIEEGADIVIVKPALGYLDIVAAARQRYGIPIAAYSVSGEYNMLLAAAGPNPDCRTRLIIEMLTCIRRSGADMIITYFAAEAARFLRRN